MSRRDFLRGAGALGAGLVVSGPTLWRQAAWAAERAAGVHLTFGNDPRRDMAVSWSTSGPVAGAVLEVGVDESYGLRLAADSRTASGVSSVYHHAAVRGLEPGATYHYRVTHHGGEAHTGTFVTAPQKPAPFRFAAFGDIGVGADTQANTAQLVAAAPAFAVAVGDLCYADLQGGTNLPAPQDPTKWDAWLAQIQPSASVMPWMTTVGNHEIERNNGPLGYDGYLARFSLPDTGAPGAPATYAFTYGNVGVVALDGNDASYEIPRNHGYTDGAQDAWLRQTLAALRAAKEVDFIVVGFHNCMYCTLAPHGSDGGNRGRWQPLFDEFEVDLVVNGHNHGYERTHPVRAGRPALEAPPGTTYDASAGTTYMTVGTGGTSTLPVSMYPASFVVEEPFLVEEDGARVPETAEWSAVTYGDHGVLLVDVDPGRRGGVATMTLGFVGVDGTVADTATLARRRKTKATGGGTDEGV